MRVNLRMVRKMARENFITLTRTFTMGNGKMIKNTGTDLIIATTKTLYMRDIG